jgi:Putative Actinobacterial Holin-X, holin superfamily III
MAETAEAPDASVTEEDSGQSLTELVEQLGRELSALLYYESRLAVLQHRPEIRRKARDLAGAGLVVLGLLTAFVLANVAAVRALSDPLPDWLAPLLLAAAWVIVAALLARFLRVRYTPEAMGVEEIEAARAEAGRAVRATLEQIAPVLSREIALAAVPIAGDMADGAVEVAAELIENADDVVDAITDDVPGGGVVNQMWDVVLMPGRLGIRVATTVLRRGDSGS